MRSQKGITLLSLMIYVVAFLAVAGIIGTITTFFYTNYSFLDEKTAVASEYSKLNYVLAEESKTPGNSIFDFGSKISGAKTNVFAEADENLEYTTKYDLLTDINERCKGNASRYPFFDTYVLFWDENFVGWRESEKAIYYNQKIICEDVDDFVINKKTINGQNVLQIFVKFDSKSFSSKYTF